MNIVFIDNIQNWSISSQWWPRIIDQSHNSRNAPVPYTTIHYSEQKCTHSWCYWCIVGCGIGALWDLWDWSIDYTQNWLWKKDMRFCTAVVLLRPNELTATLVVNHPCQHDGCDSVYKLRTMRALWLVNTCTVLLNASLCNTHHNTPIECQQQTTFPPQQVRSQLSLIIGRLGVNNKARPSHWCRCLGKSDQKNDGVQRCNVHVDMDWFLAIWKQKDVCWWNYIYKEMPKIIFACIHLVMYQLTDSLKHHEFTYSLTHLLEHRLIHRLAYWQWITMQTI